MVVIMNPGQKLIKGIMVGGHRYDVIIQNNSLVNDWMIGQHYVVSTACIGRWNMSNCPTGDLWLDGQLQFKANEIALDPENIFIGEDMYHCSSRQELSEIYWIRKESGKKTSKNDIVEAKERLWRQTL